MGRALPDESPALNPLNQSADILVGAFVETLPYSPTRMSALRRVVHGEKDGVRGVRVIQPFLFGKWDKSPAELPAGERHVAR